MSSRCHYCKGDLSAEAVSRNRLCPHCTSELHACKNCVHYSEASTTKCLESHSPWFADRAAENDCQYFEFKTVRPEQIPEVSDTSAEAEAAKKAFRALFRNA